MAGILKKIFKNSKDKNLPFIHPSYANEKKLKEDNQRLEFLGDSLIGFLTSLFLYEKFKEKDEGFLSLLKSKLVSKENLSKFAKKLKLEERILLSRGEEKNKGRENPKILSDTFEAYISFIFLNYGLGKAKKIFFNLLKEEIEESEKEITRLDEKSYLQQICQKKGFSVPFYNSIQKEGPSHKPLFESEVYIEGKIFGKGIGFNKKEAEKKAALEAIKKIEK